VKLSREPCEVGKW